MYSRVLTLVIFLLFLNVKLSNLISSVEVESFSDRLALKNKLESYNGCMSLDKCTKRCEDINICVSLFHHANTSKCRLHTTVFSDVGSTINASGWKYYSLSKNIKPSDCEDLRQMGEKTNGVYHIYRNDSYHYDVYCDMTTQRGGWTVFQRRYDGSTDFYLGWNDYLQGFGNVSGEFWLGLERLYELTSSGNYELRIDLKDKVGVWKYAIYSPFLLGDASADYTIDFTTYTGDAGDALTYAKGLRFATYDNDYNNCASRFGGAWWYRSCHYSNLNGLYGDDSFGKGLNWKQWHGHYYSLSATEMKVRKM